MKLEDVQFAIRQRTILECLDITFLFCGRHWLGLLLTASMGIVPLACFNWWVADIREMNGYGAYLMLVMEMPWATMFVTLYLGQTTFSQRISLGRMLRDALRAFPGLFVFQVIIRGSCLVIGVLSPFVFVGMFYLNEIILLEKPPLSRIWNRRVAMNARILGRIVSIRVMDLMVLCVGTWGLAEQFRAISSLWEDRLNSFDWIYFDDASLPLMLDWQMHAAFWVVVVFLTVFRFVSYLDSRIRREGWDVELKLRAQAALLRKREEFT